MRLPAITVIFAFIMVGCAPKSIPANPSNSARFFSDLFYQFQKDAQNAGLPPDQWYPHELKDFIKKGYISPQDFEKATRGLRIFYIPPSKNIKSNVLLGLFLDRGDHLSVYGEVLRDFSHGIHMESRTFYKAEQDAAANP